MIIIIPEKKFKENVRTLVAPRDYIVADATGDESANMRQYSNCIDMEGLNPPAKLNWCKGSVDKDDILSKDKIFELEQKWINGKRFIVYAMGCIRGLLDDPEKHDGCQNIFIVMNKKGYKNYRKMIIKKFEKLIPDTDFPWIIDYEELKKKRAYLDWDFKDKQIRILEKGLKRLAKKYGSD